MVSNVGIAQEALVTKLQDSRMYLRQMTIHAWRDINAEGVYVFTEIAVHEDRMIDREDLRDAMGLAMEKLQERELRPPVDEVRLPYLKRQNEFVLKATP